MRDTARDEILCLLNNPDAAVDSHDGIRVHSALRGVAAFAHLVAPYQTASEPKTREAFIELAGRAWDEERAYLTEGM
jgi:hypothetical protein